MDGAGVRRKDVAAGRKADLDRELALGMENGDLRRHNTV